MLPGRPYGGCAILWRIGLTQVIKPVQVESLSKHVCSIMLTVNDFTLLILCVYFPTDPGSAVYRGADLHIVLADINDVLLDVNCNGIVLGEDLNSDFIQDTGLVQHINTFMRNHSYKACGIISMWIILIGTQMVLALQPLIISWSQIVFIMNVI